MPPFRMPNLSNMTKDPWPLLAAWIIGGLLSIIIPVLKWNSVKQDYYDSYGYAVEYEQQQRAYEEQQNGNNQNNYYNYPSCHWWQIKCRINQFNYRQNADGNNNNNNNGEYQLSFPNWFIFFGGTTEEDQRWKEEQGEAVGESTGATKFVYAWSIIMFVSILIYGGFVFWKKRAVGPLLIMMCMFFQFAILATVLICQGVLLTDERDLEDSIYGWYGQIGVLMVYTNTAYLWFTFIFVVVLLARALYQRKMNKQQEQSDASSKVDAEGNNYYAADDYQAPEVKVTA